MTFLSWTTGLIFAGITIPLLLLLYFLKLRRQERKVSSTFLWKKAVQDLQVNAPFQKLRKNLLLFLQLLLLAALLLGIADPIANFSRKPEQNIVVMIDRSASMKTLEEDGRTRLEHAQQAATEFVRNLPDESNAMVIAFGSVPSVGCTFTDDKRRLEQSIQNIEPSDERSLVGEALPLAIAYSTNLVEIPGIAGSAVPSGGSPQGSADIEFFSDGRIADANQQIVTRGKMRFYRVGQAEDNVGITAFDVRRDFERPGMLSVFVQVENFGPTPVKTDITIALNGKPLPGPGSIRELNLGPARDPADSPTTAPSDGSIESEIASAQNVIFEFHHEAGGVIEVKLHREDALAVDNVVYAPIDPPRDVRALAVSSRPQVEVFFRRALHEGLELPNVDYMTTEEYEQAKDESLIRAGRSAYDIVIFDNHSTNRLPPGNYIFFGGIPEIDGISVGDEIEGQPVVFGRGDHPLMRYVNYDGIYINRWKRLKLPPHALGLMEGPDSIILALLTDPGHRYVIAAFDFLDSNLYAVPSYFIFIQNAVGYLASGGLVDIARMIRPGATLSVTVPGGATEAKVLRPDGHTDTSPVRAGGVFSYARTREVGVYRISFNDAAETSELFAANLLDPGESMIEPNEKFSIGSEAVEAVSAETTVNRPLWPYAVLAAIAILLIEWWVYNKRVMI